MQRSTLYNQDFSALYAAKMENGNTALKPLAPLSARPNLYLVPKAVPCEEATQRPSSISKLVLASVGFFTLLSIISGNSGLAGDILGCGAVTYFAVRCLTEE